MSSPGDQDPVSDPDRAIDRVDPDVAALYQRHHARLRRTALHALPPFLASEADVVLMTVFTRLLSLATQNRLPQPANWEAYLVHAVKNACLDNRRARRDKQHAQLDIEHVDAQSYARQRRDGDLDPTAQHAVDNVDSQRQLVRARSALSRLDERTRTIVDGVHLGRSNAELGRQLGITGQRVGQLYRQALEQLRGELTESDD